MSENNVIGFSIETPFPDYDHFFLSVYDFYTCLCFIRKLNVSFCSKLSQYLQVMLNNAVRIIQADRDLQAFSSLSFDPTCNDTGSLASSVHCFLSSPIFNERIDQSLMDTVPLGEVIQVVERLLKAFVNLYEGYSQYVMNLESGTILRDITSSDRIVDMELDVNDDSRDVDSLVVGKTNGTGLSSSTENWKIGMISLISNFFSASHVLTWDILFNLMEKEYDPKVDY